MPLVLMLFTASMGRILDTKDQIIVPAKASFETNELIRELRQQLDCTQTELAIKLGVSFRTINRWENGRAVPSPLALKWVETLLLQMARSSDLTTQTFSKALIAKYFPELGVGFSLGKRV